MEVARVLNSPHGEHLKEVARVLGSSHEEHLKEATRVLGSSHEEHLKGASHGFSSKELISQDHLKEHCSKVESFQGVYEGRTISRSSPKYLAHPRTISMR